MLSKHNPLSRTTWDSLPRLTEEEEDVPEGLSLPDGHVLYRFEITSGAQKRGSPKDSLFFFWGGANSKNTGVFFSTVDFSWTGTLFEVPCLTYLQTYTKIVDWHPNNCWFGGVQKVSKDWLYGFNVATYVLTGKGRLQVVELGLLRHVPH